MNNTGGQTYATPMAPSLTEGGGQNSPYFRQSTSEAQGYHTAQEAPVKQQPAAQKTGQDASFSRSNSEPQAIVQAEKTNERHGVTWRLKNAFLKSENAIGTWMTLGFIKGWTNKTMGAWGRNSPLNNLSAPGTPLGNIKQHIPAIPGMDKFSAAAFGKDFDKSKLNFGNTNPPKSFFEKTMAVGVTGALIQNLVFFMTARGGEIPDGDTMGQRVVNSLKNPDKHSVHFSNATMSAFIGMIGVSRLAMGVQDIRKNPGNGKKNTMMMISGMSALLSAPLIFVGMFGIKKQGDKAKDQADPKAEATKQAEMMDKAEQAFSPDGKEEKKGDKGASKGLAASLKPGHLKEMWEYAVKNDRMGLVGRALAITMELGFMVDGRMRLQKDPTDTGAYNTVKGGLIGLVLTCMQTHFVYDRLLTDSKKEHGAAR